MSECNNDNNLNILHQFCTTSETQQVQDAGTELSEQCVPPSNEISKCSSIPISPSSCDDLINNYLFKHLNAIKNLQQTYHMKTKLVNVITIMNNAAAKELDSAAVNNNELLYTKFNFNQDFVRIYTVNILGLESVNQRLKKQLIDVNRFLILLEKQCCKQLTVQHNNRESELPNQLITEYKKLICSPYMPIFGLIQNFGKALQCAANGRNDPVTAHQQLQLCMTKVGGLVHETNKPMIALLTKKFQQILMMQAKGAGHQFEI